jgi:hypothetical protein
MPCGEPSGSSVPAPCGGTSKTERDEMTADRRELPKWGIVDARGVQGINGSKTVVALAREALPATGTGDGGCRSSTMPSEGRRSRVGIGVRKGAARMVTRAAPW